MKKSALLLLCICLLAVIVPGCKSGNMQNKTIIEREAVGAYYDEKSWAYIRGENGIVTVIEEAIADARITPNRKYIVVLRDDGTLYYSDSSLENKTNVADHIKAIDCIQDKGFFYQSENDALYRLTFSDGKTYQIPNAVQETCFAESSLNLLYAAKGGNIYSLRENSTEPSLIGSFKYNVKLAGIADNGRMASWYLTGLNNKYEPVINDDEKIEELESMKGTPAFDDYVYFTKDGGMCVLFHFGGQNLYMKIAGKESTLVELPNVIVDNQVFTSAGYFEDALSSEVGALYCMVAAGTDRYSRLGADLYQIELSGEKKRILSGIKECVVAEGVIVYRTTENTLFYVSVKGGKTEKPVKIANDVHSFQLSPTANYVCYFQDANSLWGSLNIYKIGDEKPTMIASDVRTYIKFGTDEETIFYQLKGEMNTESGPLYMANLSDIEGSKVVIDGEVQYNSLSSNLKSGLIDPNDFSYRKSISRQDDQYWFDLMCWNGAEASKNASRVCKRAMSRFWW